jgi:epoxyqueuosine reductase
MENDIEESVMAIPADNEEHQEVRQAINEFEEGVMMKSKGDNEPYYCVKYCRRCELVCPVGKFNIFFG